MKYVVGLALVLCAVLLPSAAQRPLSAPAQVPDARDVTFCQLASDPAAYNAQLVRLTAFVTHGFEDFHISQPDCPKLPYEFSVWVEYGGTERSNTIYCYPGESAGGTRSEPLTVNGIQIPLVNDVVFQQFTDLLKKEADTTVHATLVGRFFSGREENHGGPTYWAGFGHVGCCSLFVVERVEQFAPHTRNDLDYTSEAGWYEKEGCKSTSMKYINHVSLPDDGTQQTIAEQKLADDGARSWAFNEPERVAVDSLKPFFKHRSPVLHAVKKTPVRQVFRWRSGKESIVITVIRPYWLSFYAKSSSVAWVSTDINESSCQ